MPVVDPHFVADREARRSLLVRRPIRAVVHPDFDLVAHRFFYMLLDFVAGERTTRRAADRRQRIAVAAADLITDQRPGDAPAIMPTPFVLPLTSTGAIDATTPHSRHVAGASRESATRCRFCALLCFCGADSARGNQPARAAAPIALKMITEIAAMISSGYKSPLRCAAFGRNNAACMTVSPARALPERCTYRPATIVPI